MREIEENEALELARIEEEKKAEEAKKVEEDKKRQAAAQKGAA